MNGLETTAKSAKAEKKMISFPFEILRVLRPLRGASVMLGVPIAIFRVNNLRRDVRRGG